MTDALGWRPNYSPKVSIFDDLGTRLKHFIKTTFGWCVIDLSTFGLLSQMFQIILKPREICKWIQGDGTFHLGTWGKKEKTKQVVTLRFLSSETVILVNCVEFMSVWFCFEKLLQSILHQYSLLIFFFFWKLNWKFVLDWILALRQT